MKKLLAIIFLFVACSVIAQVPAARIPYPDGYWHPGVPGGIPTYTNAVYLTNYGGIADGTTDNTTALNNALAACPNGGAVYVGSGVWAVKGAVNFPTGKGVVLRGAGRNGGSGTRFVASTVGGKGTFNFSGNYSSVAVNVTAGYNQWSTNFTVSTTAGLNVGDIARFIQTDDSTVSSSGGTFGTSNPHQGQFIRILSVNAGNNTVTFTPPIFHSGYAATNNPRIAYVGNHSVQRCGIEDISVNATNSTAENIIYSYFADQCWALRVATSNALYGHIAFDDALNSEIRHCDMWYHQFYDNGTGGSKVGALMGEYTTACWVEDNISQMGNLVMMLQKMPAGNVLSYNASTMGAGSGFPTYNGAEGFYCFHGDHANYNLLEGNVIPWFSSDNYWGDNVRNVIFRNWIRMESTNNFTGLTTPVDNNPSSGSRQFFIDYGNLNYTVVANILGFPKWSGVVASPAWYSIGLDRVSTFGYDPRVTNTMVRLANFNWSDSTTWSNYSGAISNSYIYASKPAWFGNLAWPPFGPDVDTTSGITNGAKIPAQYRLYTGTELPTLDPAITQQPTTQTTFSNYPATFTLTASGSSTLGYQWNWYGTNVIGATNNTWQTPAVSPANSNSLVYCVATNASGSITSATVALYVYPDPYIQVQPTNQFVTAGQTASFSVVALGATALQYKWYWNFTNVPSATSSTFTTPPLTAGDNLSQVYCNVVDATVAINTSLATNFVASPAAIYYVATNGSSANNGLTASAPWPLSYALTQISATNTLIFLPGSYPSIDLSDVNRHVGTTLQSQIKWGARITASSGMHGIATEVGVSNVVIDGFHIDTPWISGVKFNDQNSTVRNCWINNAAQGNPTWNYNTNDTYEGSGVEAHNKLGTLIEKNLIEYCGAWSNHDHAIYINGTNCIIRNNVLRYNLAHGIQVYEGAPRAASNIQIYNNLIYGNGRGVVVYTQTGCTNYIYGNTIISTNAAIESSPILVRRSPYVVCTNNILQGTGYSIISDDGTTPITEDYNIVSVIVGGSHDIVTNSPGFVNTSKGLYWLNSTSPARSSALGTVYGPVNFFGSGQLSISDRGFVQYSAVYGADTRTLDPSGTNPDYWVILVVPQGTGKATTGKVKNYHFNAAQ